MNSTCRANRYTLAAHTALRIIDISHIILYGDCFKRTLFRTFSATDTCIDTSLTGNSTFVFVYTADKYTTGLRSFLPQFNDILRTVCRCLVIVNGRAIYSCRSGLYINGSHANYHFIAVESSFSGENNISPSSWSCHQRVGCRFVLCISFIAIIRILQSELLANGIFIQLLLACS